MTISPRAIEAATQRAYEKFNENLIGCCEPTWSELTGDVKQRLRDSIDAALTAALAVDGLALQGWQDISTAPKDGTPIIGAVWKIRWADSHRIGEISRCWYQPEFDAFISSCREMTLAQGYTFENGATRNLHSPVIEPISHWMPLPKPPAASDREERR